MSMLFPQGGPAQPPPGHPAMIDLPGGDASPSGEAAGQDVVQLLKDAIGMVKQLESADPDESASTDYMKIGAMLYKHLADHNQAGLKMAGVDPAQTRLLRRLGAGQ